MSHSTIRSRLDELVSRGLCRPGADLARAPHAPRSAPWSYAELAGRMVEVSSDGATGASLTLATGLVVEAQDQAEPVAWVSTGGGTFFPPDADAAGVDLDALAVVRVAGPRAGGRVADKLMRSGGFGLVVLDLGDGALAAKGLTPALQGRLHALAQRHGCAFVCLTDKRAEAPSLGPGVSLRVEARRRVSERERLSLEVRALKDRRGRAGWSLREDVDGPPGVR
jgi:recombination protein RecA